MNLNSQTSFCIYLASKSKEIKPFSSLPLLIQPTWDNHTGKQGKQIRTFGANNSGARAFDLYIDDAKIIWTWDGSIVDFYMPKGGFDINGKTAHGIAFASIPSQYENKINLNIINIRPTFNERKYIEKLMSFMKDNGFEYYIRELNFIYEDSSFIRVLD